jgi:hypothetical protein
MIAAQRAGFINGLEIIGKLDNFLVFEYYGNLENYTSNS